MKTGNLVEDQERGKCLCGCGRKTVIARQSLKSKGWIRGEPIRFVHGHNGKSKVRNWTIDGNYCWLWNGSPRKDGYCKTKSNGKYIYAHRFIYQKLVGPIPKGLILDHLCRKPKCVNPDHLEPVTHVENLRRGKSAKLNPSKILEIKKILKNGVYQKVIAKNFNVSATLISYIKNGKRWK